MHFIGAAWLASVLGAWSVYRLFSGVLASDERAPGVDGRDRAAFVHLFEWSWPDVARECEQWLGPKGFKAAQVSPPTDHIQGPTWWTRYQPVTFELVSRSGSEAQFRDMVRRCKAVGVDIYVDAVFNQFAAGIGTSISGKAFGNRRFPDFDQRDFHHLAGNPGSNCGIDDWDNKTDVQYCDLLGMPDLCTGCPKVQSVVGDYLSRLWDAGVAGIRIDAAKHQDATELGQLLAKASGSLYRFQEVIGSIGASVPPSAYFANGDVTEFNYAMQLAPNFLQDGKFGYLDTFGESWGFIPSGNAVVFLDNHDTQRNGVATLTHTNAKLYQLANVFMLAHPFGYPKVMSSYYFSDKDQGPPARGVHTGGASCGNADAGGQSAWICEHRWTPIANMVAWRKSAGGRAISRWQAPGMDTVAFCRGSSACVALNRQESSSWHAQLRFSLPAGRYCNVAESDDVSSCPTVVVSPDGSATLEVPPLGAVALHVGKKALVEGDLEQEFIA